MTSSRRLPPNLAWPVRPSDVKAMLGSLVEHVDVAWMTWDRRASDVPVHVTWSPNVPAGIGAMPAHDKATLWIGPIDRAQIDSVRELLEVEGVLRAACDWLAAALAQTEVWRSMRHERAWVIEPHGSIRTADADGVYMPDRKGHRKYRAPIR